MSIIVREATPDDAEQLVAHVKAIAAEPGICVPVAPDEFAYTVEEERRVLGESRGSSTSLFLVAVDGDTLVGELTCRANMRTRAQRHVATLGMSVKQGWRGKGIGGKLLAEGIAWAKCTDGIKRIELRVFTSNEAAIRLYRKHGFEVEGVLRKAVYRHGEYHDDYVMALLLQ